MVAIDPRDFYLAQHLPKKCAPDVWDYRFAALGIFEHFAKRGFGFFLLPSKIHAHPSTMLRERKPLVRYKLRSVILIIYR